MQIALIVALHWGTISWSHYTVTGLLSVGFGHELTECGPFTCSSSVKISFVPSASRMKQTAPVSLWRLMCGMEHPTPFWLHIHCSACRKEAHLSPVSLLFYSFIFFGSVRAHTACESLEAFIHSNVQKCYFRKWHWSLTILKD